MMKKFNLAFIALSSILCQGAIAATETEIKTITAICADIKGPETQYFSESKDPDYQKNKFYDYTDGGMSKKELVLVWELQKKEATIALREKESQNITTAGIVFPMKTYAEQITFFGSWDGAPIMLSIYPQEKIAILAQQSTQFPLVGQGARAFMFHSRCDIGME